jgi:hypothetical protein
MCCWCDCNFDTNFNGSSFYVQMARQTRSRCLDVGFTQNVVNRIYPIIPLVEWNVLWDIYKKQEPYLWLRRK